MAGKKGGTTQLQTEVNNEEDWEKLLQREGLIIIDVYSEWSGPCVGMIGNLRKAKVEFGGDYLHLAIAKNDDIEVLERFRNRSEPTWLFAAGGLLLNVTFGANAPRLMKMIEAEMKQELKVLKGETWRHGTSFYDLCEEERERVDAETKRITELQRAEEERARRELEEKRWNLYSTMAEQLLYETVMVCLPHTLDAEGVCIMNTEMDIFWRTQMMYCATQYKGNVTISMLQEIFYDKEFEPDPDLVEDLALGPCVIQLARCQLIAQPGQEGERKLGELEKQVSEALYGSPNDPNKYALKPTPNSLPGKYTYIKKRKVILPPKEDDEGEEEEEEEQIIEEVTNVPGCWTPTNYLTKCAAIRFLFPARAERVMPPEEPPIPPKILIAFDVSKQKDCFDLKEEYESAVLEAAYFSSTDPTTAEPLCATPEQYLKLPHNETDKIVFVLDRTKSEPLLSFANLGACYVSYDEEIGKADAEAFFPSGVEMRFPKLEEIERGDLESLEGEEEEDLEELFGEEEEEELQDEDDLMALLGVGITPE